MKYKRIYVFFAVALAALLVLGLTIPGFSQSRRQPPTSNEKKNKRPGETKPGEQEPLPQDIVPTKPQDIEKVTTTVNLVNIDVVVYHKKSGQIVTGLKKPNFAIYSDGTQQDITNFATPEAPITVALVVEYSKWSEMFGLYGNRGYEPGTYEVIRPTAMFLSQFIKPPDDYVTVVAFDIRLYQRSGTTERGGEFVTEKLTRVSRNESVRRNEVCARRRPWRFRRARRQQIGKV
jgi:hypothetical protein